MRLCLDDTDDAADGGPDTTHIKLIEFFRRWNRDGSIMIHCKGGISRSPAAALIALALINPGKETEAGTLLRRQGRLAQPISAMLQLADAMLQLEGRLVAAGAACRTTSAPVARGLIELPCEF